MCLTHEYLNNQKNYNWEGDRIIHKATIANSRIISDTKKKYEIDIRELLLSQNNSVIKAEVEKLKELLNHNMYQKFIERKAGSFDLKMKMIVEYIEQTIKYSAKESKKKGDNWLFPDETITLGYGDCEDRAILIASMASAVGISSYNIRVVIGYLVIENIKYDHVWMMYKNEIGNWTIFEPNDYLTKSGRNLYDGSQAFTYIPYFCYNKDHLWGIKNSVNDTDLEKTDCFSDYLLKEFKKNFFPGFSGAVHKSILKNAFIGIADRFVDSLSSDQKSDLILIPIFTNVSHYINRLATKANMVDFTFNYDALSHFDNSQIVGSANQMLAYLNNGTIDGLARGIHALQDFYAHTSFAHFATVIDEANKIIEIANINMKNAFDETKVFSDNTVSPVYDGTGPSPFNLNNFEPNYELFKDENNIALNISDAITFWKGKLVSGRFGQPTDSENILEGIFQYVDVTLPNLNYAAGVPHHNDIAPDEPGNTNKLYNDTTKYQRQFDFRKNAAEAHTRKILLEWIEKNENEV